MSDIAAFLAARYDEDEDLAREAGRDSWVAVDLAFVDDSNGRQIVRDENMTSGVQAHIARHDPERVLADIAADRAILRLHETAIDVVEVARDTVLAGAARQRLDAYGKVLRIRAARFAGHPDYDPAWKVDG